MTTKLQRCLLLEKAALMVSPKENAARQDGAGVRKWVRR